MIQQKFSIYIHRDTIARKCPTIYKPSSSTVKLSLSLSLSLYRRSPTVEQAFQQPMAVYLANDMFLDRADVAKKTSAFVKIQLLTRGRLGVVERL